jgi:hypothetical protein
MNWIKRNAGLAGILLAGIVSTGVTAYLVAESSSAASEKLTTLKTDSDKLARLQNAKPAPTKENSDLLDIQASALEDLAGKLEKRLLESNLNVSQLDGTAFQDALNKLVREVKAKAQDSGIVLSSSSSDFSLDFDRFTKEVPKQTLLPALSRQLAESEFLINVILKHQPSEIRRFEREKAPEEDPAFKPKAPEPPPKTSTPNRKGAPKDTEPETKPLPPYQAKNYQITVVSRPEAVRGLLGELSASKKPFVTVKAVTVSNEKKDGPKRKSDNPLAAETPDNQQSLYIVGEEKVETSLSLEILTFRDAPQSPAGQSAQPAGK